MRRLRSWLTRVALAACVLLPLAAALVYVANPRGVLSMDPRERVLGLGTYRIPSGAMAPTLQPGRIVIVRTGSRAAAEAARGDIVTFVPAHRPDQRWIKRLVGLPGETIELRGGRLVVDGREIREPYVDSRNAAAAYSRDAGPWRVPDDAVFLMGDNRDNSEDSRFLGPVPRSALHGRKLR